MPRFICPHCHHPLATETLERVRCAGLSAWACPCCDELIPRPGESGAGDGSQSGQVEFTEAPDSACAQT